MDPWPEKYRFTAPAVNTQLLGNGGGGGGRRKGKAEVGKYNYHLKFD